MCCICLALSGDRMGVACWNNSYTQDCMFNKCLAYRSHLVDIDIPSWSIKDMIAAPVGVVSVVGDANLNYIQSK